MEKGYVYKIMSPNGRVYIGKTFRLKKRLEAYKGVWCYNQKILYNSLLKYGWSAHTFDIIYEGNCDENTLCDLERQYIIEYNSFIGYNELGMNLTLGGEGSLGHIHSEDTKNKISNTKKLATRTDKEKIASEKRKGVKLNKTEDWIIKNTESIKKPILQYSLEGKFIKEWKSAKDVELELGFCRKNISSNLRGITYTAYDYIWIRVGEEHSINDIIGKINKKMSNKPRKVIDIDTGKIYKNVTLAAKVFGLSQSALSAKLLGKVKNNTTLRYEK
jgi:group I intron endonuclease